MQAGVGQGIPVGGGAKVVSMGGYSACAINSSDMAYCWGRNDVGQLGNGSTTGSFTPVPVSTSGVLAGKTMLAISSGTNHACAIASDNNAYCWGAGASGQLGNGLSADSSVPVAVSTTGVLSGKTILAIAAGDNYTCAIASDNQAYCWGGNGAGQLGNNSTTPSNTPVVVNTSGVLSGKQSCHYLPPSLDLMCVLLLRITKLTAGELIVLANWEITLQHKAQFL